MCIIMHHPKEVEKDIPYEYFKESSYRNRDGMGLMYVKDETLRVVKQMNNVESFYDKYLKATLYESDVTVHFRLGTSGKKYLGNVHPFFLTPDLAFCHNGVLPYRAFEGMSDTRVFREAILKNLDEGWEYSPTMQILLEDFIGNDKMVFMKKSGEVFFLNERKGHTHDNGWWFSNHNYKALTTTKKKAPSVSIHPIEKYQRFEGNAANRVVDANEIPWEMEDGTILCTSCVPEEVWENKESVLELIATGTKQCEKCSIFMYA